mmetsp:Transcript_22694/g.37343  ORF Transcript_22694/g.37343 Transcript_22694/m.37343 type:complete len:280 (-) Transcript_22694:5-844(-)
MFALLHMDAIGKDGFQTRDVLIAGAGAVALVLFQGDRMIRDLLGLAVLHLHDGGKGHDLIVKPASLLRGGRSGLGLHRIAVLLFAGHAIARGHSFGRLQHGHVDFRFLLFEPGIAMGPHLRCLHHRHALHPAADDHIHPVLHHLLGGRCNRHHTAGALPVQRHARDRDGQPRPDGRLPRDVRGRVPLLQRCAEDDVGHFGPLNPRPADRMRNRVRRQRLRRGGVERAAIGFANGGAGGGNDNGVAHDQVSFGFEALETGRRRKRGPAPAPPWYFWSKEV